MSSDTPAAKTARSTTETAALKKVEMLLSVSQTVAATQSNTDVLESLVALVTQATGAERATLFLHDSRNGELYSRVTHGGSVQEIRIPDDTGISGDVFQSGTGTLVHDAGQDSRFEQSVDERTGFVTKNLMCAPVTALNGEVVGVVQALNKLEGDFTEVDLVLLEAMATQAAMALQNTQLVERIEETRRQERELLDVVSEVSSEIQLGSLLQKIMSEVTRMLDAERSTLFLNDEKTDELWSEVGEGLGAEQIRFPNHLGIAGLVFSRSETINIPHAYADLRFNPEVDRKTGFFTRSILCVPVITKDGKRIGVTQVLNKRGGPFSDEDEQRLKAFTAQVSIALENAKLFAEVQNMKNYNESMLESMADGVITFDNDGTIVTCNAAGLKLFGVDSSEILGRTAEDYFIAPNDWVVERLKRVAETQDDDVMMDAELIVDEQVKSVNLSAQPLLNVNHESLGSMIMIEDISSEKRIKSTMARYMDPALADRLLEGGDEILGGQTREATVLFSDIRGFTTFTEELGAQGTVTLLNEYFTIMVECLQREDGMLDKFIGDAIMAVFGIPLPRDDDADRAVRTACAMISGLTEWNEHRAKHGQPPIDIGIGLNTDEVVSGNIGSPKRMDYTIIGDGVNLAARLESACKQYGTHILVSENTIKCLKDDYLKREVDRVIVKGKTQPVSLYEILEYYPQQDRDRLAELLGHFQTGLSHYQQGRFSQSLPAFERAAQVNPEDHLSNMYVERCQHLLANPPEDWQGVWRLTEK